MKYRVVLYNYSFGHNLTTLLGNEKASTEDIITRVQKAKLETNTDMDTVASHHGHFSFSLSDLSLGGGFILGYLVTYK